MQEPGTGEGAFKNPTIDIKVQAEKKALQEGDSSSAREMTRFISNGLSGLIEQSTSSSDPLAYSLKMVATNGGIVPSLKYLLRPSVDSEPGKKIKMVYVTQGTDQRSNDVTLLHNSRKEDPFDEFAENKAIGVGRGIKSEEIAFLDDIAEVYRDVTAHGIRKDPADFTVVHRGDPLSPKLDQHIKSLPFTGKLKFSTGPQKPELQKPQKTRVPSWEDEHRSLLAKRKVENERKIANEKADKEREDEIKINEYLSKPGVKDVLKRFSEKFNKEAGNEFMYGITSDGLVVAVRSACSENKSGDNYYKAWVLDAKLPANEIESAMITTNFHELNVSSINDSDTTHYSFPFNRGTAVLLSDEEIKGRIFPPGNTQLVEFYRRTGGFHATITSTYPNRQPSYSNVKANIGGERTLYPLIT